MFNAKLFRQVFIPLLILTQYLHSDQTILGHNGRQFQLVENWGEHNLKKVHLKNCQGMVTDSQGRLIILTDDPRNNIIIVHPNGSLIKTWTLNLKHTHGLSVHKDQNGKEVLFITDTGPGEKDIFKITLDGKVLMTLGYPESTKKYSSHKQYRPSAVLVTDHGEFYVLDGYGLNYIIHYNKLGEVLNIFGGDIGEGEGQLKKWGPHGGVIDDRNPTKPTLLIACSDQQYLKRFTLDGSYLETINLPGANPRDIVIHNHQLFIPHLGSDWPKTRNAPGYVSILNTKNQVISNIGGTKPHYHDHHLQKMTHHGSTFHHPHALTFDHEGNLYVAQWASGGTWPLKFRPVNID